jgi:serine protease AprX
MRIFSLLLLLIFSLGTSAQEDAWIYLNQKPNAEYFLANPLEILSQRALDRRAGFGIPVDFSDVPIHQPFVLEIDQAPGIVVMATSKWLNAVHVRGSQPDINNLMTLDFVSSVYFANHSLQAEGRPQNLAAVSRPQAPQVDFSYGSSANQIQMLNGHILHQQDFTGLGKIIAVLDAGFPGVDTAEPFARLRDQNLILGGYNFVNSTQDIYTGSSHGTIVLSAMGGYSPGQLVGTAPDAGYYLFITEDVSSENPVEESYWVMAAEMADSLGVDIINSSLGYSLYDNPAYSYSHRHLDGQTGFASRGADMAFSKGMVVVVSAGNSGNSDLPYNSVPADAANALSVGAVNALGNYASFSSIGPTGDGRLKPDVVAQGVSTVVATPSGAIGNVSGTSLSAPLIAGMVACLWQAAPHISHEQITSIVKQSAHLFSTPNLQMGHGIPNFLQALNLAGLGTGSLSSQSVVLYPNPVKENIRIQTNGGGVAYLTLYNSLGQRVLWSAIIEDQPLDVSGLAPGLYIYRLDHLDHQVLGKLIKQ